VAHGFFIGVQDIAAVEFEAPLLSIEDLHVSYQTPTRWFVRFFGDKRRTAITTLVSTEEARSLAEGFDVEDSPPVFGVSRVYLDGPDSVPRLRGLILRSLAICRDRKAAA